MRQWRSWTYGFHLEIAWRLCTATDTVNILFVSTANGESAFDGMEDIRSMLKSPTTSKSAMNNTPLGPATIAPGEILREEFLVPMGLSIREVSRRMGCGAMRISEIINGKRQITPGTAIRLAKVFDTTPMFWMILQLRHDLAKAQVSALRTRVTRSKTVRHSTTKHLRKVRKLAVQ